MKKIRNIFFGSLISIGMLLAGSPGVFADTVPVNNNQVSIEMVEELDNAVLSTELDEYGRPYFSHYIGRDRDQMGERLGDPEDPAHFAQNTAEERIGKHSWKNFKIDGTWVWNRGHMIGNQFGSLASNVKENIVPQTQYANQELMRYYEGAAGSNQFNDNALDNWVYLHPNYYLDYAVMANYADPEHNYPQSVTLRFRGLDENGEPIQIILPEDERVGSSKQTVDADLYTYVTIHNIQPGMSFNYITGQPTEGEDPYSTILEDDRILINGFTNIDNNSVEVGDSTTEPEQDDLSESSQDEVETELNDELTYDSDIDSEMESNDIQGDDASSPTDSPSVPKLDEEYSSERDGELDVLDNKLEDEEEPGLKTGVKPVASIRAIITPIILGVAGIALNKKNK